MEVYIKFLDAGGEMSGKVMSLEHALYIVPADSDRCFSVRHL